MNRFQLSKQEVPQLPYDMFPEIDNRIIDVINRFLKQKVAAGYSRYTLQEYIYLFPRFFEKCNKWPLTEITSYDIAIPVEYIQYLLGHQDLEETLKYIRLVDEAI